MTWIKGFSLAMFDLLWNGDSGMGILKFVVLMLLLIVASVIAWQVGTWVVDAAKATFGP